MTYNRSAMALAIAAMASAGVPSVASAAGFYLADQSIKAIGRAYSGEAADQGVESLWWNPASIAGITTGQDYFGIAGILPSATVRDTGTVIVRPGQAPASVGGDPVEKDPVEGGAVPAGAIAYPITKDLAVGLALTSPYSFTTQYSTASWARYTATRTRLTTIDVQPTIAYRVLPWLSLGGAANIEYTNAVLRNSLPNLSAALPDGAQKLKGDGWDAGFTVGAQATYDILTVGLSYKSSIEHNLGGSLQIAGLSGPLAALNTTINGVSAQLSTPWQAVGSFRIRATKDLTLNFQGTRFGWNKFDAIRLSAPLNTAVPENYRNTWAFAGGFDYAVNTKLTVRGGFQYDQTPTRNGERDARVPDASRRSYSAGLSYQVLKSFGVDAAFSFVDFGGAAIDRVTAAYAGSPLQTPILVNGRVSGANAYILSLGGHLSF